jgi:type I restriction enzyme S subunit
MIARYGPPVFQILRGMSGAYNVALMKAIPNEKLVLKDYWYY